jgi:YD repeat-containing protein
MKTPALKPILWAVRMLVLAAVFRLSLPLELRGALPEGRAVSIENQGSVVQLSWLGIADAPYGVQGRTNLSASAWGEIQTVTGVDGETVYPVPHDFSPSRFFRVLFPQPRIEAGEPAFAPAEGGTVYITGQFFYAGDQIRIGGVALTDVVFLSPTLLSATLPPLPPGLYGIEVLSGQSGGVLAALPEAVEVSPPFSRTLQEPPRWPPAGPSESGKKGLNAVNVKLAFADDLSAGVQFLSKKGYDYYQAQSALQSVALSSGNGHVTVLKGHALGDGHVTVLKSRASGNGHVTVLKGRDDDCDGIETALRGKGHVTVLKSHDQDCDGEADLLLHSGEVQQQVTDLCLPGRGLDFVWTRTYRSRTGQDTPQGTRWSHGYDVRCAPNGTALDVTDGTGRLDTYRLQADGTYSCPELFREGAFTGGVFRLTFADTGFWEFLPLDTSPASGKLARIQDRNGNAVTLSYDGSGRLAQIHDTLERVHTVAYTPEGRVAAVTDSTGRTVTYSYYADGEAGGSAGDLRSVTSPPVTGTPNGNDFPSGKTVAYTYSSGQADPRANHLLLSVTDALGQVVLLCDYDLVAASPTFQRCVSAQRGTLPPACVTYLSQTPSPDNRFAALRCIVNDPEGHVSERSFDLRNRCVAVRDYTGRATPGQPVTDTVNRPAVKLRGDDPDDFQMTCTWNRDSLLLGASLPGGSVLSFVREADLNPFTRARKRADLRRFTQRAIPGRDTDSDGDGTSDIEEITQSFAHDPRFGSDPTLPPSDPFSRDATLVTALACSAGPGSSSARVLPTVNKRFGIGLSSPDCPLGVSARGGGLLCGSTPHFIVAETDPNGNTTTAEYDVSGNRTRVVSQPDGTTYPIIDWDVAYDLHGQPTACTHPPDAAGRRKTDAVSWHQGLVTQIVEDAESGGLQLTTGLERDSRGNVTRIVDPRGTDVLITYNALNQRMSIARQTQGATFGERVKSSFSYDANNNLVGVVTDNRHPDGRFVAGNPSWETVIVYDALSRPTLLAHELSHTVQQRVMTNQFVYDANDRLVLHRLPEAVDGADPDNLIAYSYDERGLFFSEERASGTGLSTVDTYDYDANGNLARVSKIDAFTIKQSLYAYDGFNRCVKTTDAMGNVATRCFDANGNLTYERADGETTDLPGDKGNRKLAETRYTYDALSRRTSRIVSFFDIFTELALGDGQSVTACAYAPNGQLSAVTNDNGHGTTFAYDRVGRLASVTDPKGNLSVYAYDPNGNLLSVTQADRSDVSAGEQLFTRTFAYDALNRCVSATDNAGNGVTYAYDSCDRTVSETDPSGNETVYAHDGLGRVTDTTHYDGEKERGITINTSHVEYRNNRLISVTDANTNTTSYAYDACERCVSVSLADGTSEALIWSPRSNLERRTDANGTTVSNTFDLCDRLVRRDIAPGPGVMPTTTFESFYYDALGRLVAAENDVSSLTCDYDSLGNRVACTQDGFVATATYDGEGNRLSLTCPSGRAITAVYDGLSRAVSLSLHPDHTAASDLLMMTFAYDGQGRLARVTRSNGINTRLFWNGQQNTPNAAGDSGWQQVSRINHARAGGGQVVDQRSSAYDRSQNKILRAMTAPWSSGGSLVTNIFGYDKLHRLTRSRKSGSIVAADYDYVYDANGNRLQVTNNGIEELYARDATLPEPADFQMNQYTDTPFGTEGYDARGNRVIRANSARSTLNRFDYAARLVQVDTIDPSDPTGTPVTAAIYSYDPLGRRIGKTVFSGGGLPPVTTTYVYDDVKDDDCDGLAENSLLETHENGTLKRTYVAPHVFETKGSLRSNPYTFDTTMFARAFADDEGHAFFHHEDELGNTLALTDASGNVVEHYDYDDFGAPRFFDAAGLPQASSATGNDLLFRGLRWDAETGLYSGHSKQSNPLYQESGASGVNPLYKGTSATLQNNPAFTEHNMQGAMPDHRSARGGGVTWHECFITSYGLASGGGGGTFQECFLSYAMDPGTGQTLGRDGSLASGGCNDRSFAFNNPWTGEPLSMKKGTVKFFNDAKGFGFLKEEGGRHTPFHNKYRPASAFSSISNVLKTKHDTAKNSVNNIR